MSAKHKPNLKNMITVMTKTVDILDRAYHTVPFEDATYTGLKVVDHRYGGFTPGQLSLVLGAPAMGKSILAMQMALHNARHENRCVAYFSPSECAVKIAQRMLASIGNLSVDRIRAGQLNDKDWKAITKSVSELCDIDLLMDDSIAITADEIKERVLRQNQSRRVELIIIDSLDTMYQNDETNMPNLSRDLVQLSELARDLPVPIVVTCTLHDNFWDRDNHRPTLSDIRKHGNLQHHADNVLLLYRYMVFEDCEDDLIDIITAQCANGPTGRDVVRLLGPFARLEDVE